ncbi:hypothetical protein CBM2599_A140056 [Cupriavidus taiwanensis]|uniref:Uncharacterized protein n=1 Tax=Cupriavidus taiwanensis TaxID=164546 RepID=A0A375CVU1_9BURK|nr:hypothetical protein CBM2600_A120745 [Cupriavidus taiwanensis]SOY82488.1 hypothetical protein CBM2599_A140056 [Cupriavidus taiwanensis]SPA50452.1 protein of unknown function [Cupriavidus taiwanensis]SPD65300.1 protein of unknown function [Cupriavidus taiwanensis]
MQFVYNPAQRGPEPAVPSKGSSSGADALSTIVIPGPQSPVVLTTGAHTAPVVEQDLCNLDFMVCKGAPTLPCP